MLILRLPLPLHFVTRPQAFDTVPHAEELQLVWPHNMNVGRARDGSVVRFEAWGGIDMQELGRNWSSNGTHSRAQTAWGFQEELQNVAVVALSHREQRVVHVTLLVDASGLTTRHAELLWYLEMASVCEKTRRPARPLRWGEG